MKISEAFTGAYFKAADFPRPRNFVVEAVLSVPLEKGPKPAVRFHGEKKKLILNKTNAFALANAFGDDTDSWRGHQVQVFAVPTFYQGERVKGLCVQPVTPPDNANTPAPSAPPSQPLAPEPVAQQLPTSQAPAPQQPTPQVEAPLQAPSTQTTGAPPSQPLAPQSVAQQLPPNQATASQQPTPQAETPFQAPSIDYEP